MTVWSGAVMLSLQGETCNLLARGHVKPKHQKNNEYFEAFSFKKYI